MPSKLITLDNLTEFKTKSDGIYAKKVSLLTTDTLLSAVTKTGGELCHIKVGSIVYLGKIYPGIISNTYSFFFINDTVRYSGSNKLPSTTISSCLAFANKDDLATDSSVSSAISSAIAGVYKIQGSESVTNLNSASKVASMNGYVYNVTSSGNLNNQDASTLAVSTGDNVLFVWDSGSWYWDKMAASVDLSGYVQTSRTIAGNNLSSDISDQTLTDSLVLATNTEIDGLFS